MNATASKTHEKIPKDYEVQPLKPGQKAKDRATCGHCGLSWDDGKITSMTPTPSGRCPFEAFHIYQATQTIRPRHRAREGGNMKPVYDEHEEDCKRVRSAIAWAEHFRKPKEVIAALWVRYTELLNTTH